LNVSDLITFKAGAIPNLQKFEQEKTMPGTNEVEKAIHNSPFASTKDVFILDKSLNVPSNFIVRENNEIVPR